MNEKLERSRNIATREPFDYGPPERSKIPLQRRREQLLRSLSLEEKRRFDSLEQQLEELENDIKKQHEVTRLQQHLQLGGKSNLLSLTEGPHGITIITPAFHTRYDHAALQSELAKVAIACMNLPLDQAKVLVTGAWLHDVGRCALGHVGDRVLQKYGIPDHEQRFVGIVQTLLQKSLSRHGITSEALFALKEEQGALGKLEGVLDTLSYLLLDTESMGISFFDDSGGAFLHSIVGLNEELDCIVVSSPEPIQQLLETRASMMQRIYHDPANKMAEEAKYQLLQISIFRGELLPQDLMEFEDHEITVRLQSLVQQDRLAAKVGRRIKDTPLLADCQPLYRMSMGILPDKYEDLSYPDVATAKGSLNRRSAKDIDLSVIVPPSSDYTCKEIPVLVRGSDTRMILKAHNTVLRNKDVSWIVYAPQQEESTG